MKPKPVKLPWKSARVASKWPNGSAVLILSKINESGEFLGVVEDWNKNHHPHLWTERFCRTRFLLLRLGKRYENQNTLHRSPRK